VVEDTTTTGGSLLKALAAIEAAGLVVAQCFTVVDRQEGAVERLAQAGYDLQALTTRSGLSQARSR
jgi:orotate phosphoribosyltransferase